MALRKATDPVKSDLKCCPEERVTKDEFAKEVNIREKVKRMKRVGGLVSKAFPGGTQMPQYGDFTSSLLRNPLEVIARSDELRQSFLTLPADFRARFDNDMDQVLEYMQDPENAEELIDAGILPDPNPRPAPTLPESFAIELAKQLDVAGIRPPPKAPQEPPERAEE